MLDLGSQGGERQSIPETRRSELLHHKFQSKPRFWMPHVKQEIITVDVVDVAIVVIVSPGRRPGIDQDKGVAAILKFRATAHYLRMMHGEVMFSSKLSPEALFGNAAAISTRAIVILRAAGFPLASFLPWLFLTARFWTILFLAVGFLLRRPHVTTGLGLLLPLLLFRSLLLLLGPLLLLLGVRGPGFVLLGRLHFILSRGRLGLILPGFGTGLILPGWLLLPLGLFLLRFLFLLFVVLRVKNRRTRDHSREDSQI